MVVRAFQASSFFLAVSLFHDHLVEQPKGRVVVFFFGDFFSGDEEVEGVAEIVLLGGAVGSAAIADAALIAEFAVGIEKEGMGSGEGTVGEGGGLGVTIVEIGEGKFLFPVPVLHVLRGVAVNGPAEFPREECLGSLPEMVTMARPLSL